MYPSLENSTTSIDGQPYGIDLICNGYNFDETFSQIFSVNLLLDLIGMLTDYGHPMKA